MGSPLPVTILVGLVALGISWAAFGRQPDLQPRVAVVALLNTVALLCLSAPQIISDQKPEC